MRPKFVFALGCSILLIFGAALFLRQYLGSASAPATGAETVTPAPAPISNSGTNGAQKPEHIVNAPPAPIPLTPEQRQAAIDAEKDRLFQWSVNDDPASLASILADLTNPEKKIREAAIQAAKQFGSSNAIPVLKDLAANTSDTKEQIALLEAAEFLALPTVADSSVQVPKTPEQIQASEQQKAQKQAQIQSRRGIQNQQPIPDPNSQPAPNQ